MTSVDRALYHQLYGPTVGDRVRLADTDLLIEVTEDRCVGGDEAVFGLVLVRRTVTRRLTAGAVLVVAGSILVSL